LERFSVRDCWGGGVSLGLEGGERGGI